MRLRTLSRLGDLDVVTACSNSPSLSDTANTTNPGKPNIAAAALRSRSTWGLDLRVHEHHGS